MTTSPGIFKTWGQLLRLPNLFTVPGDALAGGLLVSLGVMKPQLAWACVVVIMLYMAGLLLNDYFDRKEDAEERPDRPIPAGHASAGVVLAVGGMLIVAAVALAFFTCSRNSAFAAAGLALCVFLYDVGGRKIPIIGQLLMGACRGGSVAVGAFAVGSLNDWSVRAILVAFTYTAVLTLIAANETAKTPPKRMVFFPGLLLAIIAALIGYKNDWSTLAMPSVLLMAWGAFDALIGAALVARGKLPVPPFIGRLIRVMLTTQAAWILLAVVADRSLTLGVLVVFLLTRYLSAWASKHFYAS